MRGEVVGVRVRPSRADLLQARSSVAQPPARTLTAEVAVTMADPDMAIMAAMVPLITAAGTPRCTVDMGRVTMLPPTMVPGTGALFAPHTRTALDTMAGVGGGGGIAAGGGERG